ncbi:hypothetical protein [Rhodobacter lacus]|uniref:Flagellar hook-length control protein n=1 Tax=Rhodobacter lacus TaxID=1641972 RepID=A0ABW5A3W6_9RHOB
MQHRETLAAGLCLGLALWIASRGGWLLAVLGLGLAVLCGAWALLAWRRTRFARPVAAPGVVDLDEGRIGYYGSGGATLGGYMALADLIEIRLLHLNGAPCWRLKSRDGQALLIPVAAAGAEKLFDAFATLPGIELGRLSAALSSRIAAQSLWQRRD